MFVVAENRHLEVRIPVARGRVRGLPRLGAHVRLKHGRLPAPIWREIVATARTWAVAGREVLLVVLHEPPQGYRVHRPTQVVGAERVLYRPTPATVLEIHSHHRYPAWFSRVDDADEQGFRLYGVVGRLDLDRPEVALRVGAYGHFLPLAWEAVFDADPAQVLDVQLDPSGAEDESDDVPG